MKERTQHQLLASAWVFAAGSAVHTFDHLRRGQGSVTDELHWVGTLALVLQVVVVTLVVTRHRLGPLVAVSAGFPLALGYAAAHWLPEWSPLSDPLWEIGSWGWFSYVASTLEVAGAVALGLAGLAVIRNRGLASFARREGRSGAVA